MSRSAVNKASGGGRQHESRRRHEHRYRGRRILGVGIVGVVVVALVLLLTDTVAAMRTEHDFSRALVTSPRLTYEPEVTISGFPFLADARTGDFAGAVITARGVPVDCASPAGCRAELGATLGSWSAPNGFDIESGDLLHTSSMEAYTRLDSVNLGRMLGILDLTVNTPAPEDKAGAAARVTVCSPGRRGCC
ncbi:LmeA family phospholipid-binding protein [Gordonia sp. SID5947]|uniref:LmeA family phospholipid-binding protein n=1 Tax=Gordonia sp. SID5947 TaxID=2690315 RepID=UPI0031BB1BF8